VSAIDDHYVVKEEGQRLFDILAKTVKQTQSQQEEDHAEGAKEGRGHASQSSGGHASQSSGGRGMAAGKKRSHGDQEQRTNAAVLRWVGGGHATAFIQSSTYFIPAICQAFDMLDEQLDAAADLTVTRSSKRRRR
jgi:hypothetical protein